MSSFGPARRVSASAIAEAVERDPQFHLPRHPTFSLAFVVIPLADGVLIDGGEVQQVFRGSAAALLLPQLLPLLDGSRTIDQVLQDLPGVPASAVRNAIVLLFSRGLLAEADGGDPVQDVAPDTLAFCERFHDVTRAHPSGSAVARRLAGSTVHVWLGSETPRWALPALQQMFSCMGMRVQPNGNGGPLGSGKDDGYWIALAQPGDESGLGEFDQRCAAAGVPWLHTCFDPQKGVGIMGPYLERGETPCYTCFSALGHRFRMGRSRRGGPEAPSLYPLWLTMVAQELVLHAGRLAPPLLNRAAMRWNLPRWTSTTASVPWSLACACVGDAQAGPDSVAGGLEDPFPLSALYETAVGFPSAHLSNPKSHQLHYSVAVAELAAEVRVFPNAGHMALPKVSPRDCLLPPASRAAYPRRVEIRDLATLLLYTAGFRTDREVGRGAARWAATGGNLGSPELFVLARDVAGLEPGLYAYEAGTHTLARLRAGLPPRELAVRFRDCLAEPVPPGASIILTGALHRLMRKYGPLSYRIAQLDAGVACGQLEAGGLSLGLHLTAVDWRDAELRELLGIESEGAVITGVVHVT